MSYLLQISKPQAPVTYILTAIILLVSLAGIRKKSIFAELLLHPYGIFHQKQYYRLITSDFVHNDFVHLILNVVTMAVFCSDLEENLNQRSSLGSWQFLGIFIISQLVANVIYTIRYRNKFDYSSAGCSASVMGCLFAFMIADPNGTAVNFSFIGGIKNVYTGLIYISLLIYFKWRRGNEMVNHEIHLYGAIGGILAIFLVGPEIL